ncbi:MAG TPA: DUF3788 family protein [Gemmatimonadales bacterium]|nr:DUF3788 family protein [Gemmatimonadales bacterium]
MTRRAPPPDLHPPDERDIAKLLGRSRGLWERLRADLIAQLGPLSDHWAFSRATSRWSLRLKRNQRTVVYLVPRPGHFLASFALGEKACRAAQASGLPASVLSLIDEAPRYPEGRGVRLEVRTARDVGAVEALASLKMTN